MKSDTKPILNFVVESLKNMKSDILARITLHELLQLSKATQDALRKALADSESLAQIVERSIDIEESCPHCYQVTK